MRLRERRAPAPPVGRRLDAWIYGGLLVLLAWLPLPWGSRSDWAAAVFGIVVAALVLARMAQVRYGDTPLPELPPAARLALVLWLLWLAWVALQLVPLPGALLAALSPHSFEAHEALRALAGTRPLHTISLLPGTTLDQWLLSAALMGLFWLVLVSVARARRRQRWLLATVAFSGLAQALYGIVMTLSGWEYGFFEHKAHNIGFATGTFVNKNHFAGYLALSLCAGIALVLADLRPRRWQGWRDALDSIAELALSPRFRVRVSLAVVVIALVLTRSRMGNGAFFFALALCGSGYVLFRHRRYFGRTLALFLSIFLIDLWIVSDWYGLERLAERIEQTDIEQEGRAAVFTDMAPLAGRYLLTGSGLGTFAAAFSPQRSDSIRAWFDHAHNDHLEFIIEAGLPGYLLLCLLAALVLVHATRLVIRRHDPLVSALGFAGAGAVVCMAVLAFTDFALRIPAVAATLVALMALTLSSSSTPSDARPLVEPREPE